MLYSRLPLPSSRVLLYNCQSRQCKRPRHKQRIEIWIHKILQRVICELFGLHIKKHHDCNCATPRAEIQIRCKCSS